MMNSVTADSICNTEVHADGSITRDLTDVDKAKMVVAALQGRGKDRDQYISTAWDCVVDSTKEVVVTDLTGCEDGVCGGQGNAFKVSLAEVPEFDSSSVVLHRLRDGDRQDSFCVRLRNAAAEEFSEHELGPKPIVSDVGDWWIETFEGVRCGPWKVEADFKAMGLLLAQVHKSIPTTWFDRYRTEIISKWPLMNKAAPESPAWVCVPWPIWELDWFSRSLMELEAQIDAMGGDAEDISQVRAIKAFDEDPEFFSEWADMGALKPEHPAARRLVTVHGDFHPGNVLVKQNQSSSTKTPDRHICIDFEQTCVCSAIYDLAFVVNSEIPAFVEDEPSAQMAMARAFLAAYLAGLEQPHANEAELDMLVTDCMLGGFFLKEVGHLHWDCLMRVRQEEFVAKEDPRGYLRECKAWAAEIRAGKATMCAEVASGCGPRWEGKVWPCRRIESDSDSSD